MGPETATNLAAPQGPDRDADERRVRCLRSVGDVIRLYEELERALGKMDDRELAHLATTSRSGEQSLAALARRLDSLRGLKRCFESGTLVPDFSSLSTIGADPVRLRWAIEQPRGLSLVWEAVAFAVGFGVSFLLI